MKKKVCIDVSGILKDVSNLQYKHDLGISVLDYDPRTQVLTLEEVIDEEAHFINLFGLCIDLETGNIALGLSPKSNDYILMGNAYDIMKRTWFVSKRLKTSVDLKYVSELLKLDPIYYKDEIVEELKQAFDNKEDISKNYSSIMVNYAKTLKRRGEENKQEKAFEALVRKNKVISSIAYQFVAMSLTFEDVARSYYGAFITEQTEGEIKSNCGKTLKQVIDGRSPNMETLTLRYVSIGFPMVFLSALKSYGLGITDRKNLFNKGIPRGLKSQTGLEHDYTTNEIIDIGIALSSKFYARNITKKEYPLAYNFMDLLRAVNWEHNILFALESITELQSKVIWESLLKKFNIYDILSEQSLSEKEFVLAVDAYRKSLLVQVDYGLCYKRMPSPDQYKMLSYSVDQLETAGNVFEMTFTLLNKSLKV